MEAAGGAAVPPAYRSAPRERSPLGAEGGKLGREVSGGKEADPARFTAGGERPCGLGAAGSGGSGLAAGSGGRGEERKGEEKRGEERALPLHTKGSRQGREPRGAEGRRRAGPVARTGRPGAAGAGSQRPWLPTSPSAPCDAGFGFALFLFVRCEGKWSARKEASRAGGGSSLGGG